MTVKAEQLEQVEMVEMLLLTVYLQQSACGIRVVDAHCCGGALDSTVKRI